VTGTVGVLAFCQAMVMGVLVLFALERLHLSGTGYGLFMAAMALGNVVGGLIATRAVRRFGVTGAVVAAAVLASVGYLATAMTMSPYLAAALLALEGVAVIVGNVATISFRQALVPDELQARVANVWRTVIYGAIPIGALVGGGVAAAWGLRMPFVVAGVVQLVLAVIVARPLQRLVGTGAAVGVVG
jgi:MFS family permease